MVSFDHMIKTGYGWTGSVLIGLLTVGIAARYISTSRESFDDRSKAAPNAVNPTPTLLAPDPVPPVIVISNPKDGSVLKGKTLLVSSRATDPSGIKSITITIDGKIMKVCTGVSLCTYQWNISAIKTGSHVIVVSAMDNSFVQNTGSLTVTVIR